VLDSFAGEEAVSLAQTTARAVEELLSLEGRLEELQSSERDRARELDVLRSEIAEIDAVAPRPLEGEDLALEVKRLEHADAIASGVAAALEALRGDRGVGELVPEARRDLDAIADKDPRIAPLVARLDAVSVEVTDVVDELARLAVPTDPSTLAAVRERIGMLTRLRRKYGASEEDVLAFRERSRARVAELEEAGSDEATLVDAVASARKTAESTAERLSNLRHAAAAELGRAMERSMAALALPDARFEVALEPRGLYRGGRESVGFKVAANPGEPPRPLAKVASGGELSRISLALRLLTSAGASTVGTGTTMVFDEVDAGVGGEAARAVGECLAELGQHPGAQVLVVTHLPQVAAFADHQYVVAKDSTESHTASVVTKVEGEGRVGELSRMLAGLPKSERAREHAQELLELAVRQGQG
jgi:DNA repair protein RecN (Recombination protein N)